MSSIPYEMKQCPQCSHTYQSYEGYTDWCDVCNWNVKPRKGQYYDTLYEIIVQKLGDRYSKSLYQDMCSTISVKPGISWQMVVSFIIAILVVVFWLFLLYADIFLILQYFNIFAIIGSVICTMLLVTLRPRISKPPKKYLSKNDAPILFNIIEELSTELGASTIDYVVLNHVHNASMGYRGITQKRVLTLGYPLLLVLDAQETVELISHELAHNINRDPMRGYVQ